MKLYIATPINARQEPTMREKLVAAKHRVQMLKKSLRMMFGSKTTR